MNAAAELPLETGAQAYQSLAMNMMSRSAGKPDRNVRERVTFHRSELNQILQVYGRMVAAGEWKDYGISHLRDAAVFCVFRSATEIPLYRIEKRPGAQARQGMYSVVALDGRVLRRGPDLAGVLRVFERKPIRLVRG